MAGLLPVHGDVDCYGTSTVRWVAGKHERPTSMLQLAQKNQGKAYAHKCWSNVFRIEKLFLQSEGVELTMTSNNSTAPLSRAEGRMSRDIP